LWLALCAVLKHEKSVAGVRLARCIEPHARQSLSFSLMNWIAVTGGARKSVAAFFDLD
jgi:hypothetical protein